MQQYLPSTATSHIEELSSMKYVASLVKGIADMVLIFDQDYQVIYANHIASEMLNTESEDLVGRYIFDFFPKNQTEFLEFLLQETMEQEQVYNRRTQFQIDSGAKLPVSISFSILSMDGELEGYMLVAKDNRQLVQATDALKHKNQQLERLFYRMSHDFQGPLATIQGMLELARMDTSSPQDLEDYIKHIQTSTEKLKHTLNSLMQLQYSDDPETTIREVTLRPLLESVVDEFSHYPGREEVLIHITANPQLNVQTDEKIIESTIQHVVENSIKFRKTNASDSVTKISVRNYKDGIKIKVKDNGLGMDRDMQRRAFDMFYRGHGHMKGSGLGLFIVKSNVEKVGGTVEIKGQPFLGTEVCIYIPNRRMGHTPHL
ncbi:MAG: ATP-binding protein [Cyclobacteriaceae bacterium]